MNRPIASPTMETREGWGHAEDLVPIVAQFANRDAADVEVIRWARKAVVDAGVARGDLEGEARAVLAAAERDIRYTDDPVQRGDDGRWETHDLVQAPIVTLELRAGDCVAFSALIGSALQSLGRVVRYVVTALEPGVPRHITVEVEGPRGWFTLDPVPQPHHVGYGQHVQGAEVRAWSPGGEPVPLGAFQVAPPGGAHILSRTAIAGGLGDVPPEVVDLQAELVRTELGAATMEKIALAAPYLDTIASVNRAVESGDPTGMEQADEIVSTVTTFTSMAGPYGAVLSAVIRALWALGKWLVNTYPAHEIRCSEYLDADLPRELGFAEPYAAGKCYRDAGIFYVATYVARLDTLSSFHYYESGETYHNVRFDIGPDGGWYDGQRWDDFLHVCAPIMGYATDKPPGTGYRSWAEWESLHPEAEVVQSSWMAQTKIAEDIRQRLRDGGLRPFHFGSGDLCESYGYAFPVSALPDATLLELIRRMMVFAIPEGEGIDADVVSEAVALEPLPPGPDLPEGGSRTWRDGLANALFFYVQQSDFKDYHFAALLEEYSKRREPGGSLEGLVSETASEAVATALTTIAPRTMELRAMPTRIAPPLEREEPMSEVPVMVEPPTMREAIPEGMSTQEAQVLAAIRYQDAVRDATRAEAAAHAYYGMSGPCGCACDRCPDAARCPTLSASLGALGGLPRIVDETTETDIVSGMRSKSALLADRSLSTWAAQANYGLSHLLEPLTRRVVAVRLMNWKRAHGWEPLDSYVDDAVRSALATDGGFSAGAVPTLGDLIAKVGEVRGPEAPAEPVEILPAGTLPAEGVMESFPTATGLPGAVAPVIPSIPGGGVPAPGPGATAEVPEPEAEPSTSRAYPEGATGGAVMVSPPGSAEVTLKTKTDTGTILLGVLALYYASRRRRPNPSRRRRRRGRAA